MKLDCTVEKVWHSGMLVVSAMVGGYRVARTYMGFTRKEALRLFKKEVRG